MCISIPAKITAIAGNSAIVTIGSQTRKVFLCVDNVSVGNWVLINAGAVIGIIDENIARETNDLLNKMQS